MICPHCDHAIHVRMSSVWIGKDADGFWDISRTPCPNCSREIIQIRQGTETLKPAIGSQPVLSGVIKEYFARPLRTALRKPAPQEVDAEIAADFNEACEIESLSPKAAAALARRCLQNILKEKAAAKKRDLADQIQEVLDAKLLPSHLAEAIDGIRNIGNFAAHPLKNTASGQILSVEPGEVQWCLDTLEGLLDFYFVQPARTKARIAALNQKLSAAGKPLIKQPSP